MSSTTESSGIVSDVMTSDHFRAAIEGRVAPASGPAAPDVATEPMMTSVRNGFNNVAGPVGDFAHDLATAVSHPAALPVMAGLGGLATLILAWRFTPDLLMRFVPGMDANAGFLGRTGRTISTIALAGTMATFAYELINNGMDPSDALSNTLKDLQMVGGMLFDAGKGVGNFALDVGQNGLEHFTR